MAKRIFQFAEEVDGAHHATDENQIVEAVATTRSMTTLAVADLWISQQGSVGIGRVAEFQAAGPGPPPGRPDDLPGTVSLRHVFCGLHPADLSFKTVHFAGGIMATTIVEESVDFCLKES